MEPSTYRLKAYSAVARIDGMQCDWVERISHWNRNVQALTCSESVIFIEMIFIYCLIDVHALSPFKNAYFVSCIDKYDYQNQEAAYGAHFGRQWIFALV